MGERMLEQVDAVRSVLSEDRNSAHLVITWQDHHILESVVATFKGRVTWKKVFLSHASKR